MAEVTQSKRIWSVGKYIFSLLLFFADLGTDIYTAVQYKLNGDEYWFRVAVVFIITVPAICSLHLLHEWLWLGATDIKMILATARYVEALYESFPQWCLQFYVLLQRWDFPWYSILSISFSLLSLTYSSTTLELEIRKRLSQMNDKVWLFRVMVFLSEFFGYIARLVVLSVFAYHLKFYVYVLLAIHLLVLYFLLFFFGISYEEFYGFGCFKLPTKCYSYKCVVPLFVFPHMSYLFFPCLIHPSVAHYSLFQADERRPEKFATWTYILFVIRDIFMLILIWTIDPNETPHLDVVRPLAMGCFFGGCVLGTIFYVCRRSLQPFPRCLRLES